MAIASFLIEIFAATMLLLFAGVWFAPVSNGVWCAVPVDPDTPLQQLCCRGAGMVLATILQSSAAVTVLLTGFAAAGMVTFGMALAGVLGADLGAALVIQVLSMIWAGFNPHCWRWAVGCT